ENWMEANRYINMDDLREHKKLALRQAAWPASWLPHFAELDAHNPHTQHIAGLSQCGEHGHLLRLGCLACPRNRVV
ncbi:MULTISPECIES: hypothetical protein, partial [unclassified Mesorhizobium]|uniref:hypothetical protein n=1 Tax=unclassified Mesorhizobium TaxID=325217 RepID=UPI00333B1AF8